MTLSISQVLVGRQASYELLEILKESSVFKARILPSLDRASPLKPDVAYTP